MFKIIKGSPKPSEDDLQQLLTALTALKRGDFSVRMPVGGEGTFGKISDVLNDIVDLNQEIVHEVEKVANVVGKEGKVDKRLVVHRASGQWENMTESINGLVTDLVQPLTEMADVIGAVANGNLAQKIPTVIDGRPLTGEFQRTANTINTMVDRLSTFASEVTRVSREVGTEGKLGGQAEVKDVSGTWKDLTDSVNNMASNLTNQVRNIALVTTAVARGDLTKQITVDAKGEILELKSTINTMVDQLSTFASEVTRVAREVGTEGKLGGQAQVNGVGGTWKDLTDKVNSMATNLTDQVRNIALVTTAVAKGDLTKQITVDVKGEILELKNTINTMVDQLSTFASEVTRVAWEVGTEGKLGGQAQVKGAGGTWKDLTDSVNYMASNLTNQVRDIALVTTAVANGDLTKKISVDVQGEILELKSTINTMVDRLSTFASEVTRVAREVGTEGKLGGQANVKDVSGTWKDLTDSVNSMGSNLTDQVRNIALVTTAVAKGDLTKKITVDVKGEILELKNTINTMVDQLSTFASEVTRVAWEVGTEGKLGGQALVKGVDGTWKDLTDSVNYMASNLTNQVRNIAWVTTAVANGDLTKKITADVKGEILEMKNIINTMVDQLSTFASEVTRVAREVGTEGKLGGQADVKGVSGTWKLLTDNVNSMASNLTNQVRNIALVTTAVANGDLTKQITVNANGEILELKNTINTMVDQLSTFASEVTRVAREFGTEGKLGGQAQVKGVGGTWKDLTDTVNYMTGNLTSQVRNIATVTTAVANGDLSKKITINVKGELLELKNTINTMVDHLNSFASEVTRVAREVGTEGKLGGQSQVRGVGGVWRDLTDNVNIMAANLTDQVRGIAKVVTAVANGDLKQTLVVEAKGEIAELADTINGMIETLATFSDQVTTVAREVGAEGKLGGQAKVPGAAGIWRDLTDNVNQLAANLTTQVRAITNVATAVTKGDLSQSIAVEASGEVATLKDNINEMIRNLKETTRINMEQDWLKTNLANFSRLLQGQRDLTNVCKMILSELAPLVSMQHGVFYINETSTNEQILKLFASYGYRERKNVSNEFKMGEGLIGQCLIEKQRILLTNVPENYIKISSGLGECAPLNIVMLPIIFEGHVLAVLEIASLRAFTPIDLEFFEQLTESIGIVLNTMQANIRTEGLLIQSQSLTDELRKGQEELQQTNEELEEKARLLVEQKVQVEQKNSEVELAKRSLEEKAEQLALTSKYKSEFLANMSHELRTPLNSLLILSDQLAENLEGNLSGKQVKYSKTIHESGQDLLSLINDILDLSKIESGVVMPYYGDVLLHDIKEHLERTFNHIAQDRGVNFTIKPGANLPDRMYTDAKHLLQLLKNLLSNAFKFTERGGHVRLIIERASEGWTIENKALNRAKYVLAFRVVDDGIGIPQDKQKIIFEAFQQADGSTSRKYGGTGLGLAISREIAAMLDGEIRLDSAKGRGSTFTFFMPVHNEAATLEDRKYKDSIYDTSSRKYTAAAAEITEYPARQQEAIENISDLHIHDDRSHITSEDLSLLIVDSDPHFAQHLLNAARKKGFKGIVALGGNKAMELVHKFSPAAIAIDTYLHDGNGLKILDRIKKNPETRNIPVWIFSIGNEQLSFLQRGASGCLTKPVALDQLEQALDRIQHICKKTERQVIVMCEDEARRNKLIQLLESFKETVSIERTRDQALRADRILDAECIVLDADLPNMAAFDWLEAYINQADKPQIPIIVYQETEMNKEEENRFNQLAEQAVLKKAFSPNHFLYESSLYLRPKAESLSEISKFMAGNGNKAESPKKVLIVDDDIRNIFALTSLLERHAIDFKSADNGQDALKILQENDDIGVVLIDIMMPVMDGYETIESIRQMPQFQSLPVIALTAKAMIGDREKCIKAGATDYITKPINTTQLISILNGWLNQ
jgi:HAMP domain-containing protein/signal transduction histidine kinase/DNA-binding response OmpR family regulator